MVRQCGRAAVFHNSQTALCRTSQPIRIAPRGSCSRVVAEPYFLLPRGGRPVRMPFPLCYALHAGMAEFAVQMKDCYRVFRYRYTRTSNVIATPNTE